jgi:hypothetical protein
MPLDKYYGFTAANRSALSAGSRHIIFIGTDSPDNIVFAVVEID